MKLFEIAILGIGAWLLLSGKSVSATTTPTPTGATIQGLGGIVTPTQSLPTTVSYTETPSKLKAVDSPYLKAVSPAIQITEGGKSYISPYKIVEVGIGGTKTTGISFESNKYTAVSSGFLKKMKSIGVA